MMTIAEKVKQAALAQNDPAIRDLFAEISGDKNEIDLLCLCQTLPSTAFRFLVDQGVNINAKDGQSQSILDYAAGVKGEDGLRLVKEIVECGGDIHQTDNEGWSASFFAAFSGNLPVLEWLVERGANIHDTDDDGKNLHFAGARCKGSDASDVIECMKWLDTKGLSYVNCRDNAQTLLIYSCMQSAEKIAHFLIKNGVDVDELDQDNKTALMHACNDGFASVVQALIQAGADLEILDEDDESALYYACMGHQPSVVAMMMEAGANGDFSPEKTQELREASPSDACLLLIDAFKARKMAQQAIDGMSGIAQEASGAFSRAVSI